MIRHILYLTSGFRGRIAAVVAAGILRVASALVFVAAAKRVVDIATGAASGSIAACVAVLVGAVVVELVCTAASARISEMAETDMRHSIRERLFMHLLRARWSGSRDLHSGDMLSRLTDDCRMASECLCRTLPAVAIDCCQLAGAGAFLWYFSPALALTLFFMLPMWILAGRVFYRITRRLTRRLRGIESSLHRQMQESLQHRLLLKACGRTMAAADAVTELHRRRRRVVGRRSWLTVYSRTAVLAGFESGYLAAFLWGIAGLRRGSLTFGTLTAYLQLAGQIQRPIADLVRLLPSMMQAEASFARLADIGAMELEEMAEDTADVGSCPPEGIEVRDVTFAYPGAAKGVFSGFSHTFRPGSRTAITGPTGAGKSTLLLLILGVLRPQGGEILLTEADTHAGLAASGASRRRMVYVPQGNSLMSGTIRSNLLLGDPDASDPEMLAALHAAAADFVADLPLGLDTPCGEQGLGLSEGQAQRIAIARALLMPGTILLLDEISASLDEPTETLLMSRLTRMRRSHTILFVTHRPGVLRYCDEHLEILPPKSLS